MSQYIGYKGRLCTIWHLITLSKIFPKRSTTYDLFSYQTIVLPPRYPFGLYMIFTQRSWWIYCIQLTLANNRQLGWTTNTTDQRRTLGPLVTNRHISKKEKYTKSHPNIWTYLTCLSIVDRIYYDKFCSCYINET